MKLDSTNLNSIKSRPLDETDAIIVAIGDDVGASVLTCSILKNLNVKRIIGRAIHQEHQNILNQIGIEEVVVPLEDSAMLVASMLQLKNALRLTELNDDYALAEIIVPAKYIGHAIDTINIGDRFKLKLVAVKIAPKEGPLKSIFRKNFKVDMSYDPFAPLGEMDVLVLAGRIADIKRFTEN